MSSEDSPSKLIALATVHAERGDLEQAERLVTQALTIDPDNAQAYEVLGNIQRSQGKQEQALESFQRAFRKDARRVSTLSNMALCLRDLGQIEKARTHLEQATKLDASNPVIATNLAAVLFDTGRFDEASAMIDAVLQKHPDFVEAHVVRGTRLLRRGDFAQGWADYEWRLRDAGPESGVAFDYPVWDGNPMTHGTLLVCGEQGLGDQVMFASCLGDLLSRAPNCVIECDARLKKLFARSFLQARFYVQRKHEESMWLRDGLVPSAKTWLGSLPGHFRRQPAAFPQREGYLLADPTMIASWKRALQTLGTGPKIGISWHGGTGTTRKGLRSIALERWLPLLRCPSMHFVSLQYGDCRDEIERIRCSSGVDIAHWDHAIQDYDETAALVSALDLVISVQTAVVHLAGALGKPVWVLVPSVAEWRYGERGESMPWYPSAKLFRQEVASNWEEEMGRLVKAVQRRF